MKSWPDNTSHKGYTARRVTFPLIAGSLQIGFIVLFIIFGRFSESVLPKKFGDISANNGNSSGVKMATYHQPVNEYATFQDVHVMIFVGFGFLMTFLKRYSYSAVGINFMLSAFCIQWAMLLRGIIYLGKESRFNLDLNSLLLADFTTATVLISFGAVLGKASPTQLVIMTLIEVACALANEYIGIQLFQVSDVGSSIFVHAFGAYFGLAVARVLYRSDISHGDGEGSCYHSDVFAMVGTLFLWIFWPSFNGSGLTDTAEQHRAFINTYLSLVACCVAAFITSQLVHGRFNMVHVQNATLAGGVAVGTAADLLLRPFGPLLVGAIAGIISVVGYRFLTPLMTEKLKIHDTCGVHNLHGMPAILAAIIGALAAAAASIERFGLVLFEKFPAQRPDALFSQAFNKTLKQLSSMSPSTPVEQLQRNLAAAGVGSNRSSPEQAAYQFAAIGVTLAFAIVAGTITGFVMKLKVFDIVRNTFLFEDDYFWEVAPVECTAVTNDVATTKQSKKSMELEVAKEIRPFVT